MFGEREGGREGGSLFVQISPAEKSFRLVEIINYDRVRVSGHHNLYIRRQVTLQFNYLHVLNLQLYVINTNFGHFWAGLARKSYYRFCTWLGPIVCLVSGSPGSKWLKSISHWKVVIERDVNSNDKLVTKITLLWSNFLSFRVRTAGEEFLIQPRNSNLIQFVLVGLCWWDLFRTLWYCWHLYCSKNPNCDEYDSGSHMETILSRYFLPRFTIVQDYSPWIS